MIRNERFNKSRTHKGKQAKKQKTSIDENSISEILNKPNDNELDIEYNASTTETPLYIQKNKSRFESLPEPPTGKMTNKKKKRLDKFIEKQLKKDDRRKIIEELASNAFDGNGLFLSSKSIGQHKLTFKEKLKLSLLEHRAGIELSQADNRLFVSREVDESTIILQSIEKTDSSKKEEFEFNDNLIAEKELNVLYLKEDTLENNELKRVEEKDESTIQVFTSNGTKTFHSSEVSKLNKSGFSISSSTGFGSSLKTTTTTTSSKRKKKTQESSDSDSEAEYQVKLIPHSTKTMVWSSNVVDGEKIENNVPEEIMKLTRILKMKHDELEKSSLSIDLIEKVVVDKKSAYYVSVERPKYIRESRNSLPVVAEEQPIMEAILKNNIVILCGETGIFYTHYILSSSKIKGSGKTTQVPQFLYEAGFGDPKHPDFSGMVGITQPRRVAAISMAQRVAQEMNLHDGQVAYQIRYDSSTVNKNTRVKFMTDGILLRELSMAATDDMQSTEALLLTKYSCIIIDEAHERTVGTDVLIGWLTRISELRNNSKIPNMKPLKIIIMSATLRVEDFTQNTKLFPGVIPPVIKVDGRQFKVSIHYNKITPKIDYVNEAFKKVCKIHTKLPKGGILVFLTGQQEIQILMKKLQKRFPEMQMNEKIDSTIENEKEVSDIIERSALIDPEEIETFEKIEVSDDDFDEMNFDSDDEEEEIHQLDGESDREDENDVSLAKKGGLIKVTLKFNRIVGESLYMLPLYSLLPTASQMRVFNTPPANTRLCVIATNVAETSVTIPGMKYVIDCGKVKERQFDSHTQTQTFQIGWTSKSSSDQRAGRAGRVGSGHCYRLFSSAVFNDYFKQFSIPEILRVPIDSVVLQMKSMGINHVVNFPFPTSPPKHLLSSAEKLLVHLGALTNKTQKITSIGRLMANIPVSPRFSKMLIVAASQTENVFQYLVTLVCGLAVGNLFVHDEEIFQKPKEKKIKIVKEFDEDVVYGEEEDSEDEMDPETKESLKKKRGSYFKIMQMLAGDPSLSDSIKVLRAFGAYSSEFRRNDSTENMIDFCERHFMRFKAMEEVRKLCSQVFTILKTVLSDNKLYPNVETCNTEKAMKPPTTHQLNVIRQLLFMGYIDHVARIKQESSGGKNGTATYTGLSNDDKTEELCIHISSCLSKQNPPAQYVIYNELVGKEERFSVDNSEIIALRLSQPNEFKRQWMKGVTVISESWLASLGPETLVYLGKVLENPEPKYKKIEDKVVGFVTPRYGPKSWQLALQEMDIADLKIRVTYFIRFLLEGQVQFSKKDDINIFKLLTPFYLLKPSTLPKSYSQTNPKVSRLISTSSAYQVDSRCSLMKVWKENPNFLKEELLLWLPLELQTIVKAHWPPVNMQTGLEHKELVAKVIKFEKIYQNRQVLDEGEGDESE